MSDAATTTTNTPATTTSTATTSSAATPPSWTASLDADTQAYVTTKGFKEPKDVVDSYRNFEKLQGVPRERLVALPETLEGEAMNPIWEKLGAVKDAKEYKIDIPKELADEKFSDFVKETMHKLKVPRQMAEGFAKSFIERQTAFTAEEKVNNELASKQAHDAIKKEWGAAYEQNEAIANQAATKFGMSKDQIAALGQSLGAAGAMKFLHKLGEGIGESKFFDGNTTREAAMTPAQARQEIKELQKDTDFSRRLASKDRDAVTRWNRLHQFASPGEMTI